MRRLNFYKRINRCRNLRNATNVVNARCQPVAAPETCEVSFESIVSAAQRANVLSQADLFCEMCGVAPGDIDDLTGIRAKFHVELIVDKSIGGKDELSNLRTLCSTCNQGAKNITSVKPPAIWLLSQIRRAGQEEQIAVLEWLLKKFKK